LLVYALSWMEGGGFDSVSSRDISSAWFPNNARIRLQRCSSGSGGGGWGWPLGRQRQHAACSYMLGVWPAAETPLQQQQEEEEGPCMAQLTQRQLYALMDCLDAFIHQHPGFVRLPLPPPLQAPPPGWRQRLASWGRGGLVGSGNGGTEADAGGGSGSGSSSSSSSSNSSNSS
jgi:hypothetical protein